MPDTGASRKPQIALVSFDAEKGAPVDDTH